MLKISVTMFIMIVMMLNIKVIIIFVIMIMTMIQGKITIIIPHYEIPCWINRCTSSESLIFTFGWIMISVQIFCFF